MVGSRNVQIFVDPPPRGVFTYEDVVSGKLVFESTRDEDIGFAIVFFHGRINTDFRGVKTGRYDEDGEIEKAYSYKHTLFQHEMKVYQGYKKLAKNTRYEWCFRFDFRTGMSDPSALPTSGKYEHCNIEYKIRGIVGQSGQDERTMKRIFYPDNTGPAANLPFKPDTVGKLGMWTAKHFGKGAEEELQFVQVRPHEFVGQDMAGPFSINLDIPGKHIPSIRYDPGFPERRGLIKNQPGIPFSLNLDLPRNIIEGARFPLYLSVTSPVEGWTMNPPPVQLTSLKMSVRILTYGENVPPDHNPREGLVFHSKNLGVMLGPRPVDLGLLLNFALSGSDILPSFKTRVLERAYNLPTEVTINVGGKTLKAEFMNNDRINVVSRLAATGRLPESTPLGRGKAAVEYLQSVPVMPVVGYDNFGQEIHANDTKLRREEFGGPSGTWNENYAAGPSTAGNANAETQAEEKLEKGFKRLSFFSRKHDK